MAPESFSAAEAVTHKTDIYSFGVIMAEMLVGRQPWKGFDKPTIIYEVSAGGRAGRRATGRWVAGCGSWAVAGSSR